jgi:cysteine desulfurase
MKIPIYLDNNSTTPLDPRVLEAMLPYFREKFGNASSHQHRFGWIAEDAVEQAQERISSLIGSGEDELIFTSGATESINLVLKGLYPYYKHSGYQIISTRTEHMALLEPLAELEEWGIKVQYLPVDTLGFLDLNSLEKALKEKTFLVAIMMANNETGLIQPIQDISRMAHEAGALFFTDASQAYGKIPIHVEDFGIDLLAFSAHKIYGPKGIGGLYIRKGNPKIQIKGQILGGGQQNHIRSGTLNIPGIVGLGKASELCKEWMGLESLTLSQMRNQIENTLLSIPGSYLNGDKENRLPQTTNIRFDHIRAEQLFSKIPDIAISSGSACNSANPLPSHVLLNMGLTDKQVRSSIRIGMGRMNTESEIQIAGEQIREAIEILRKEDPFWKEIV